MRQLLSIRLWHLAQEYPDSSGPLCGVCCAGNPAVDEGTELARLEIFVPLPAPGPVPPECGITGTDVNIHFGVACGHILPTDPSLTVRLGVIGAMDRLKRSEPKGGSA